jgi:hypothetical protein
LSRDEAIAQFWEPKCQLGSTKWRLRGLLDCLDGTAKNQSNGDEETRLRSAEGFLKMRSGMKLRVWTVRSGCRSKGEKLPRDQRKKVLKKVPDQLVQQGIFHVADVLEADPVERRQD